MADKSHVTLKSLPASNICSKEATYSGHMLIRFWYDSDITFLRGVHTNFVTVLYFSIINVVCGAGGDANFAPEANLVLYWVRDHPDNRHFSFNMNDVKNTSMHDQQT